MSLKFYIIFILISSSNVSGDVFSSITSLEKLVPTQGKMLKLFDQYIESQEKYLLQMKRQIGSLKSEYRIAKNDPSKYVSNPINSFRLIKQLYGGWNGTLILMKKATIEFENSFDQLKSVEVFPELEDVVGSTEAMLRLQHIYNLKTEDVANGILDGIKCSSPLSSNDCYELALRMYEVKSYNAAKEWLTIALEKYSPGDFANNDDKFFLMEMIAYHDYLLGNFHRAIEEYEELYEATGDKLHLEYVEGLKNLLKNETALAEFETPHDPHKNLDSTENVLLCREAMDVSPSIKKNLKCHYGSTHWPFSKIAPFKVEELYLQPYVAIFHDVLYDSEIEYLKNEVSHKIKRAEVIEDDGFKVIKTRVSANSWLPNDHSPTVIRINNRFQDMTGLVMNFAEHPQIANYGIGGYYAAHYDFFTRKDKNKYGKELDGNRIATLLVYMSDVEQGGNTVFPNLGISVKPKKGAALFWYNVHPSGEGNTLSLHAACPVLRGIKWVLNKWITLKGNEFVKPCNLEYQDEGPCSNYTSFVRIKP